MEQTLSKEQVIKFYELAKRNNESWLSGMVRGYARERRIAFIDWCEYILEELNTIPAENFVYSEFRSKYGNFEYPSDPNLEYEYLENE
jgi:hypothetical protein